MYHKKRKNTIKIQKYMFKQGHCQIDSACPRSAEGAADCRVDTIQRKSFEYFIT